MKRKMKSILAIVMALALTFTLSGVASAESNGGTQSEDDWTIGYYWDENGETTGDVYMHNNMLFGGYIIVDGEPQNACYLKVLLDANDIVFSIMADAETPYTAEKPYTFTISVLQSSSLGGEYNAIMQANSYKIVLDSESAADCHDFIVQDMRMLSGKTCIQLYCNEAGVSYYFEMNHDSNFRDLYDTLGEIGWRLQNSSQSDEDVAGEVAEDEVTPEFKQQVDAYLNYFIDSAKSIEGFDLSSFSGALRSALDGGVIYNMWTEFKTLGEKDLSSADRAYYEAAYEYASSILGAGIFGGVYNNLGDE